ncbi:hypothetical protein D9M68_985450 [compost metagenome]
MLVPSIASRTGHILDQIHRLKDHEKFALPLDAWKAGSIVHEHGPIGGVFSKAGKSVQQILLRTEERPITIGGTRGQRFAFLRSRRARRHS